MEYDTNQSEATLNAQFARLFDPEQGKAAALLSQLYALYDPYPPLRAKLDQGIIKGLDPFGITRATLDVQHAWLSHPSLLLNRLMRLNTDAVAVQQQFWRQCYGLHDADKVPAVEYDERFQDPLWTEVPYLDVLKQYYLLYTRWLEDAVYDTPDTSEKSRGKAGFWLRQMLNALAPTNYFWTNPVAVRTFLETQGQSIVEGLKNQLADMKFKTVRMVDTDAFEVGKTLATTPGQVVYRNPLFELIQYAPTTEQVRSIPILFVPPWINKYYILDLNPKKSLISWLVQQGFTVYLMSWKNPGAEMRDTHFADYMSTGVMQAVDVVRDISQAPSVHAVGYCIGGTLLSTVMAWLNAEADTAANNPISSWTLLATLVDFSNPGEIDVFIDEESLTHIDEIMAQKGYLDGAAMTNSFRMLRANSLVWHYYVHNYLYGEELPKFDVLFWNMDSTRMPYAMHSFYLREFYLHNNFVKPGGITLGGRALDVRKIQQPLYDVSTEQDHIAPWKQVFKNCALMGGPVRHVVATSGHILGVISPPQNPPKRHYWVGEASGANDAEAWLAAQPKVLGSWWEDWGVWLHQHTGELVAPPPLGNARYPALIAAPGTYVFEK